MPTELTVESMRTLLREHAGNLRGGGNSNVSSPNVISGFSSSGGSPDSITNVVKKFTGEAESVMNDWRKSQSTFGINWSNDSIGLRNTVNMMRLDMSEFAEAIDTGRVGFTSLGGSMDESAKIFSQMSMRFSDTTASDNLAKMGYTIGDYNKLLAITITNNRQLNLQKAEDQHTLIEATERLGKNMARMGDLTGISRQEQLSKLEKDRSDMRYRSLETMMINSGKKEGVAGLTEIGITAMATGTDELVKNLAEGGKLTAQSANQIQVLGPLAGEFKQAVVDMTNASTSAEREAAKARFDAVNAEVAERYKTTEMLKLQRYGENELAEEARKMALAGINYTESIEKKQQESGEKGLANTARDAQKYAYDKSDLNLAGKKRNEKNEIVDVAGAKSGEALVLAEKRIKDAQVQIYKTLQIANEEGGKKLEVNEILKQLQNVDENNIPAQKRIWGEIPDKIQKTLKEGITSANIGGIFKSAAEQGLKGLTNITADLIQLSGPMAGIPIENLTATGQEIPVPKKQGRAGGSKEATGSWFESFGSGTDMTLHGSEAVVPADKIKEFITDMQQQIMGKKSSNDAFSQLEQLTKNNLATLESSDLYKRNNPAPPISQLTGTDETKPTIETGTVSLKDINDQLTKLDTVMVKLVTNTNEMVDNSSKQYRATKQLSPNINAR